MTREELQERIPRELEQIRVAIERADARLREFRRTAAIHTVTTERLRQDLRELRRR